MIISELLDYSKINKTSLFPTLWKRKPDLMKENIENVNMSKNRASRHKETRLAVSGDGSGRISRHFPRP